LLASWSFASWSLLAVLAACPPHSDDAAVANDDPRYLLGDPWQEVLKGRYVVGARVPLHLTEWTRPSDAERFPLAPPCSTVFDVCVEQTSFEVVSTNPTVVHVERTESGLLLHALTPGVAWLHTSRDGAVVASGFVEVAEPDRLELWLRGPWAFLLPSRLDETVTRFAGGALDLQVRYYVGERRFFGASVARWETLLRYETPTFSGNVIRISDSEVGLERVRAVFGELSVEIQVRSVDTLDELGILELGDVDFDSGEPVWEPMLAYATHSGELVHGSLPLRWSLDGRELLVAHRMDCRLEPGSPSEVSARLGGAEAVVELAGTCVEVRLAIEGR